MKKAVGYIMSVILALGIMLNAAACSGASGKTVKIGFVTGCDDSIGVIYLDVGDFYGELSVPKNTDDYKFLGWYTNERYEGNAITPHTRVSITTDHKLYAKWEFTGKIVTITFKQGNGEEDIVREYKAGYPFGDIPEPSSRAMYVFNGWQNGKSYLTAEDTVPDKDRSYIAKWTLVGPIPVSFETGYEVSQPTLNLMVGEPYGSLPEPKRDNYEFLGWEYSNGKLSEIVTGKTLVPTKESVTLTAKWKYVGDITIGFVSEGESFAPLKIKAGSAISDLPVPKNREGYSFLGWYTQDKFYGYRISDGDSAPDDNVTLYSRYEKNSEVDESRTTLAAMSGLLKTRSFAIEGGKLYVWGNNNRGELGIDSDDNVATPTLLTDEMTFTEVTAGYNGVYALDAGGDPWMWGTADNIAVTNNGTSISSIVYKAPTRMFADGTFAAPKFKSICAGGANANELVYAIDSGDKLCKLYREQDADGEFGWAWTGLLAGRNIKKLSVGGEHALAIDDGGKLWTWGSNRYGQLGDGTQEDKDSPVQIMSDKRFITVSAGKSHTLAVDYDGRLWAFGLSNTDGANRDNTPTVIMADKTFVSVSAGDGYSFAIDGDGKAWSWGKNASGRLGNGSTENNGTPQMIAADLTFAEISKVGGSHVLARTTDGKYYSWGDNDSGALGNGTIPVDADIPTAILNDQTFKYVYSAGDSAFVIDTDGRLFTWGKSEKYGYDNDSPTHVERDILFDTLAFGDGHILGIDIEGNLWSWGGNSDGQLGDGTKTDKSHPVQIMSGTKFVKISAGGNTSFAIDEVGKLWAWGSNKNGQFGNGSTTDRTTPINVKSGSRFTDVCSTDMRTYAIDADGTLWCCGAWGNSFAPNVAAIKDGGVYFLPTGFTSAFVTLANGVYFSSIVAYSSSSVMQLGVNVFGLSNDGVVYSFNAVLDSKTLRYNTTAVKIYDIRKFKKLDVDFSTPFPSLYCLDENNDLYYYVNNFGWNDIVFSRFEEFGNKKIQSVFIQRDKSVLYAIDTDGHLYIWGNYNKSLYGFDEYDYTTTPTQIQVGKSSL